MSIIIFLLVLFVLILVHEWGHFIVAKKTGMRVDEFGIGFPPKLFGVKKGETEYTINALPIGGFVRIFGENPEAVETTDVDLSRAFGSRPKWAQALVLVAGVTMNIIFAWFLFVITFLIGVPTAVEESQASPEASLYVSGVLAEGPADQKIPSGAEITKLISGEAELNNPTPSTFTEFIQTPDQPVDIYFIDKGEEEVVSVEPVTGIIPGAPDQAAVGVSLTMVEIQNYSFLEAITSATTATYEGMINIAVGLGTLLAQTIEGTADFTQVAGPVGIVGMVGDAAAVGLTSLLLFTAFISLNLAVINLLPIPALDGGRLLFVIIEAIIRRPVNPVWFGRINLIGFVLLMLLMVAVTYNDIVRLMNF